MDWNLRYQENDTPWDKGAAHPVLDGKFFGSALAGRVLVPGCGVGHDVRAWAAIGTECVGVDISPIALERATAFAQGPEISYFLGDFLELPVALRGGFDAVFEHTCLCAIDPSRRPDYAQASHLALRPGGRLCGVFYAEPDNDGGGHAYGGVGCGEGPVEAGGGGGGEHRNGNEDGGCSGRCPEGCCVIGDRCCGCGGAGGGGSGCCSGDAGERSFVPSLPVSVDRYQEPDRREPAPSWCGRLLLGQP